MSDGELVCQCIEQRLSSHTCDKCGRPRLDAFDEIVLLRGALNAAEKFIGGTGGKTAFKEWLDALALVSTGLNQND